jgi:hypothetical protein
VPGQSRPSAIVREPIQSLWHANGQGFESPQQPLAKSLTTSAASDPVDGADHSLVRGADFRERVNGDFRQLTNGGSGPRSDRQGISVGNLRIQPGPVCQRDHEVRHVETRLAAKARHRASTQRSTMRDS